MVKLSYMIIFMVHSKCVCFELDAVVYWVSSLCLIPHIFYIVLSYKLIIRYHFQCPHPNPSHCEGFCTTFSKSFASFGSNVPFLSARSRILFSLPLVALVFYIYSLILVGWWCVGIYAPYLNFWRAFAFFRRRRVQGFDRRSDSHQLSNPNGSN